jgi:hypothetical protein
MPHRHLPVRPDLDQLKHQAKDLLRALRRGDPDAAAELQALRPQPAADPAHPADPARRADPNHPIHPTDPSHPTDPANIKLADAQRLLARSYGVRSWPRLVLACRMTDAIWRDDPEAVLDLVSTHPALLTEPALGRPTSHWGPPLTYAANLGRDRIIAALEQAGAADLDSALNRAVLQGRIDTARQLLDLGAKPHPGIAMGPAETLSAEGMRFLADLGLDLTDAQGDPLAPVAGVLRTYVRKPSAKHAILDLFAARGIPLPDTPPIAVHRGRLDLVESHLHRDPNLLTRTFSDSEIWPPALGCRPDAPALHGTPLAGATLLHLCVDYDEIDLARYLLAQGMNPDTPAALDPDGFGGHTALFACVVSYPYYMGLRTDDTFARLLLDHGANPNARASLRKALPYVGDGALHTYPNVTPLAWGQRFHEPQFVSQPALRAIAERGGHV